MKKTVFHVLTDCPILQKLSQKLREKLGNAFNDISTMLGANPEHTDKGCQSIQRQ